MKCKNCKDVECKIYKQYNRSGSVVVVERCPSCRRNPNPQRAFLPKKEYNLDDLPLFEDYTEDAHGCEVNGCTNRGSEYHHFAPEHLFEDFNDWPTGWLCMEHHDLWHKITRTGKYYKRTT